MKQKVDQAVLKTEQNTIRIKPFQSHENKYLGVGFHSGVLLSVSRL